MSSTYTLLQKITIGATGAISVTFNNIPQTYTDLVVRCSARDALSGYYDIYNVTFNGNTTNYSFRDSYAVVPASSVGSETGASYSTGWMPGANATANVYGIAEFFIPNYTSSKYKAYNYQTYVGGTTTGTIVGYGSGNWRNVAAINSVTLATFNSVNFTQYSTFYLYGVSSGTSILGQPKATGGDIIRYDGTYWYHAFLSSGSFKPLATLSCDYLVVGGGGGGGSLDAGGGGAGGVVSATAQLTAGNLSYTVLIGSGGTGGSASGNGNSGTNSSITGGSISLTAAVGGGYGAGYQAGVGGNAVGGNGGSGGGGSSTSSVGAVGGTQTSAQGYAGGTGYISVGVKAGGGGGGGSGAAGGSSSSSASGAGGVGLSTWSTWATATNTGVSGYYAAGGGGGGDNRGITAGAGGSGGGGAGSVTTTATSATVNTGSGGGGGGYNSAGSGIQTGGAGASGIVIVRYAG
jgi:hypothetical protein